MSPKNHSSESGEQQMGENFQFWGQNLSLGQTQGPSRGLGMRVAFGTRNHSPQNLANRPTGALAFLIPRRPPFWSRGCSAQGHGWKCHCCFAVVFLSLSKQHGYNYCRPSSAHARGWRSCTHAVCVHACAESESVCVVTKAVGWKCRLLWRAPADQPIILQFCKV